MSQGGPVGELELRNHVGCRSLMLYDGLCGFCNKSVRWVARRDQSDRFRFAPQQSALAAAILRRHGLDHEAMLQNNSVYLVLDAGSDHKQLLAQSDVTIRVLLSLGGGWRVLGYLLRTVPSFARNAVYRLVARNRYRLGGRHEQCPLPSEAERAKFLG